jgi:hypothetical protein
MRCASTAKDHAFGAKRRLFPCHFGDCSAWRHRIGQHCPIQIERDASDHAGFQAHALQNAALTQLGFVRDGDHTKILAPVARGNDGMPKRTESALDGDHPHSLNT